MKKVSLLIVVLDSSTSQETRLAMGGMKFFVGF